jgi:hypothetical protein
MRLRSLLGLLVVVSAAAHAVEQDACAECKTAALADASQCQAITAPDPALRDACEKQFAQATQSCHEISCKAEAASRCADCLKQADVETRKCASLPPAVRGACDARAAGTRKTCDDKACPAPKAKERPAGYEK